MLDTSHGVGVFPCFSLPEKGISLRYEENAQVELLSPGGVNVLLDVVEPAFLAYPPRFWDVLLSTSTRPEHYDAVFAADFPGRAILFQAVEWLHCDVRISSVLSAGGHYHLRLPQTNTIYVVEMGGLRVAHCGALAQTELSPEQESLLYDIDILVCAFESVSGNLNIQNRDGFRLVEQIHPRLVIPTHAVSRRGMAEALRLWDGYVCRRPLSILPSMLPEETRLLIMGADAEMYRNQFSLPDWPFSTKSTDEPCQPV